MTGPFDQGPAWLFVPGNRPDRWAKAAASADVVVIDLEDAVPAGDKAGARRYLQRALDCVPQGRLVVRINGAPAGMLDADLEAVHRSAVRHVIVPMVEDPDEVHRVRELAGDITLVALCESAAGMVAVKEIAASGFCSALMFGSEDLVASLGGTRARDDEGALLAHVHQLRASVLTVGAAAALPVIDTPLTLLGRDGILRTEARQAAEMGFVAKAVIHPSQVDGVRAGFRPDPASVAWAKAVVSSTDGGANRLGDEMVDAPIVTRARRILQLERVARSTSRLRGFRPRRL